MKIIFYGDSVVAQKEGLVEAFTEAYKDSADIIIEKLGLGGRHLFPTGICFIDEILEKKPDYCFIAWFNDHRKPLEKEKLIECIKVISAKLVKNNCMPIFLLLGGDESRLTDLYNIDRRYNIQKFCKQNNIPCLDILENQNFQEQTKDNKYLRDYVHTNEFGSKLYAEICKDFLENNVFKNFSLQNVTLQDAESSRYFNIKKYKISDKQYEDVFHKIIISGKGEIIGIEQNIGQYSGIVSINVDDKKHYQQKVWDFWCHYERRSHLISIEQFNKYVEIEVLKDNFDRSNCREQADWGSFDLKLRIFNIFYTGEIHDVFVDPVPTIDYTIKCPNSTVPKKHIEITDTNNARKRRLPPPPPSIMV